MLIHGFLLIKLKSSKEEVNNNHYNFSISISIIWNAYFILFS